MSSSSNSSPSHPGCLDSQYFRQVFPAALPHCQHNILYAIILPQPFLVADPEHQSSYEEDGSIQSLVCVFHHLCSTQIYLGSLEPCTNHITSLTLHIAAALTDTLDLLHDHRFHHHVLSLPPNNITLAHVFCPVYHTLTVVEWDAYEESDLRLVNHISSPPLVLPIPTPCVPSPTLSLETPVPLRCRLPLPCWMSPLTLILPFIRAVPPLTPVKLHLETPIWAHNLQRLTRLFVFTATLWGIFMSTAQCTSALTVANVPLATLNTIACKTTVLFATTSATPPAIVQTVSVPFVTTQDMLSWTAPLPRTPVAVLSSMMETQRDSSFVPVVQVFKGGNVTVGGSDILFSIICLSPLSSDLLFTFTIPIMFFTNTFHYMVWWLIPLFSLSSLMTNTYLLRQWLIILFPAYSSFHDIPAHSMTWSMHRLWQYKYCVILYI